MTTRKTLKDFLAFKHLYYPRHPGTIAFNYNKKDGLNNQYDGTDLGKDSQTGKELIDIENEGTGLLGDYLSYLTENSSNIYKVATGIEKATASKRGDSLTLAEEQGASNVFVDQTDSENFKNLSQYSNSGKFEEAGSSVTEFLDKTGNENNAHELYKNIQGSTLSNTGETLTNQNINLQNEPVLEATNNLLDKFNRFANAFGNTAFAPRDKSALDLENSEDKSGTIKYENEFGKANIDKDITGMDKLRNLGFSMLFKASAFDDADNPQESTTIEQGNVNLQPSNKYNQYGDNQYKKIPVETLRVRNAAGAPHKYNGESIRAGKGEFFGEQPDANNTYAFGSNYNTEIHFESIKGRRLVKFQARLAAKALLTTVYTFMGTITELITYNDLKILDTQSVETASQYQKYAGRGPYPKGIYNQLSSLGLDKIKKTMLVKTNFNYSDALYAGIDLFFGSIYINEIGGSEVLDNSPGYVLAIANSVLKGFNQITDALSESVELNTTDGFNLLVTALRKSRILKFANVAATIGDIALKQRNGIKNKSDAENIKAKPFDVDSIKTKPGTRVSKSRENDLDNPTRLAWRQSSVPSMYLLPRNILRATQQLSNTAKGANPVKAMLGSELVEKTYFDRTHDGSNNRIPNDVVKMLEDKLDAEYVPFYIQDLRTNEIISFHAFLTQLNDSFNPNFTQTNGYGRLDPIQTYNSTTRTVSVNFTIVATSKEDYDQMWYKINKLVTLVYPQWTQGTKLSMTGQGDSFIMPFSQVLGASPVVRLRVGDVIKSNYSKFSLARMLGVGDPGVNPMVEEDIYGNRISNNKVLGLGTRGEFLKYLNIAQHVVSEIYYAAAGTPLQYLPQSVNTGVKAKDAFANFALKYGRSAISSLLERGNRQSVFANPLTAGPVMNKLSDPNANFAKGVDFGGLANTLFGVGIQRGKIKSNMSKGYLCDDDGEYYYINRPIDCQILELVDGPNINGNSIKIYKVKVLDTTNDVNLFGKTLMVTHENIIPDITDIFLNTTGALNLIADPLSIVDYATRLIGDAGLEYGLNVQDMSTDLADIVLGTEQERFMEARNNPFVRAYESTKGRGLAGVLGNIQFNWLDEGFTWETDFNARAPKGVQVSLSLNVIHDIAPGLDHSGYNRAPVYNVGNIMKEVTEDVYGSDSNAEYQYRKSNIVYKTGE